MNQAFQGRESQNIFGSEQQNLRNQQNNAKKEFSLDDLFASDPKEIEKNIYQMIVPIDLKGDLQLKFVQVRRERI